MATFAKHKKIDQSDLLATEIMKRSRNFQNLLLDNERRKSKFIRLAQVAVALKRIPTEIVFDATTNEKTNFYTWILEEFNTGSNLVEKSVVLENFYVCLFDENQSSNPELLLILDQLRSLTMNLDLEVEVQKHEAIRCFEILLKTLVDTRSPLVYESLIGFSAGIYDTICKKTIDEYLQTFLSRATRKTAIKCLEIAHASFMKFANAKQKIETVTKFLLPSINALRLT